MKRGRVNYLNYEQDPEKATGTGCVSSPFCNQTKYKIKHDQGKIKDT